MIADALTFYPALYIIIPVAFVSGSIPFGIIFTKKMGLDITSMGSKNIGATNVLRSAGKKAAIFTLLGDLLKGAVPVLICQYVIKNIDYSGERPEFAGLMADLWPGVAGISAVLGHMFSVFLSFRGGKGVATGFGVILAYSPAVAAIVLFIWIAVAVAFKYSALAAIVSVSAMPIVYMISGSSYVKSIVGLVLAACIIYKHKSNISNLLAGTEDRIGDKAV